VDGGQLRAKTADRFEAAPDINIGASRPDGDCILRQTFHEEVPSIVDGTLPVLHRRQKEHSAKLITNAVV
jgi:hypothetical protein